jgi:DNA-binding response OmpR family regulator
MSKMTCELRAPSVLIIDDERTFADTLAKRLSLRGIDCAVAYDGRSGLRLAQDESWTSVLLDLRLPDMDGVEVLRRIVGHHRGLPVIIITGHGNDEDERRCMSLGAVAFLHKPVDVTVLAGMLEQNEAQEP